MEELNAEGYRVHQDNYLIEFLAYLRYRNWSIKIETKFDWKGRVLRGTRKYTFNDSIMSISEKECKNQLVLAATWSC